MGVDVWLDILGELEDSETNRAVLGHLEAS